MAQRTRHLLTDKALQACQPAARALKLRDGGGLYLEVKPNGGRFWRHQFRADGREHLVSLGQYPAVSLKRARQLADANRAAVAAGVDPVLAKRAQRAAARQARAAEAASQADTFRIWADRYRQARDAQWCASHARDVDRILRELCDGYVRANGERLSHGFGDVPMRALDKAHLLDAVDGALARAARVHVRDLLTYALAVVRHFNARQPRGAKLSVDDLDPEGVRAAMGTATAAKPHARLPLQEMPAFVARLRTASVSTLRVRRAAQLLLLTGVRTTELRAMTVDQLDLAGTTWTIPAAQMKHRRRVWAEHHVPLAPQTVRVLERLLAEREQLAPHDPRRLTPLLLPNERDAAQPMSENTILAFLGRLGYAGRQTGHGFRGLISTWANREGYPRDAIERQLSHVEADKVRAAYNSWEWWPQRVQMMRAWADQLDVWFATGAASLED